MGPAPAALAVAVVPAAAAVELVGPSAAVEAVAAGAAVAAVLARAHDADVLTSAAPAAVAAAAVAAVVVASPTDAVAVAVAGYADVVVAPAYAAVAAGAAGEADVPLGVADELVRARAEVDDEGEGHLVGDPDEVAVAAHLEFDPVGVAGRADRLAVALGEVAATRALVGHLAPDDDQAPVVLLAQGEGRPRAGAVDDDLAGRRRAAGQGEEDDRQQGNRHERTGHRPAAGGQRHPGHLRHVYRLTNRQLDTHIALWQRKGEAADDWPVGQASRDPDTLPPELSAIEGET